MTNVFVTVKNHINAPYIHGAVDEQTVICSVNMREADLDDLKAGDTFGAWRNDTDEYIRVRVCDGEYEYE